MLAAWTVLAGCGAEAPVPQRRPEPAPAPAEPVYAEAGPRMRDVWAGLSDEARSKRMLGLGAALYSADGSAKCEVCHGLDGQGLRGGIPPLVPERPWARDCLDAASIVLFGSHERFRHDGLTYVGVMPPQGHRLDDLQVAAVSSYVSGRFGTGTRCEPADVSVVRLQGPMSRRD